MPDLPHLQTEKLTELADRAVRECGIRFNQIPPAELPRVAQQLLEIAAMRRRCVASDSTKPVKAKPEPVKETQS